MKKIKREKKSLKCHEGRKGTSDLKLELNVDLRAEFSEKFDDLGILGICRVLRLFFIEIEGFC